MTDNTRRTASRAAESPELRIRQKRGQVTYDALIDTARWMAGVLGKPPTASVSRAGGFPKPAAG